MLFLKWSVLLAAVGAFAFGSAGVSHAEECSLERKKAVAYGAIELWLSGNTTDPNSILAPDYTNHLDSALGRDTAIQVRNVAAFVQEIERFHQAFTDVKVVSKIQTGSGDIIATRVQISAVHSGSLFGEQATGNTIEYDSAEFTRVNDDCKVAETFTTWDKYAMFYQIGLIAHATP